MSQDCQKACTLSYDQTVRLWDVGTGKCLGVMQHSAAVTRAAFSQDNNLLLTASANNVSMLWSCNSTHKPHPLHVFKVRIIQDKRVATFQSNESLDSILPVFTSAT